MLTQHQITEHVTKTLIALGVPKTETDIHEFYLSLLLGIHEIEPITGFTICLDLGITAGLPESNLTIIQFEPEDNSQMGLQEKLSSFLEESFEPDSHCYHESYGDLQLYINFPY